VGVAEGVVHGDELDVGLLAPGEDGPRERPADAAEPVDPDSYGHCVPPGEPARDSGVVTTAEQRAQPPVWPDRARTHSWRPRRRRSTRPAPRHPAPLLQFR